MSSVNGKFMTCDRCGATIFCKCTGEGEADGGYTRWNKFEKAEGWTVQHGKHLCKSCSELYEEMIENFFGYER